MDCTAPTSTNFHNLLALQGSVYVLLIPGLAFYVHPT